METDRAGGLRARDVLKWTRMTALDVAKEFLGSQLFCVVSTIGDDGSPQSAFVAFSESDNLEVAFGTFVDSRKFRNVERDPRVSIVVSGDDKTLQIEGVARVAMDDEEARVRAQHLAKNPSAKKYAYDSRESFVIVTPRWLRYTDFTTDPDTVEELRF